MNASAIAVSHSVAINRIREVEADNAALKELLAQKGAQISRLMNRCADLQKDVDSMAFPGYELDGSPVVQDIVIQAVERLVVEEAEALEDIVRGIYDAHNEQERAVIAALHAEDRTYQWRDEL